MTPETFKAQFIATFCASWCANNYDRACDTGTQERLEHPPIEDAIFLAECAWTEYQDKA